MKVKATTLKALAGAVGIAAALSAGSVLAQAKEQFFPVLSYRTGAYAPNGTPWANGYVDYLKLVNAKGGINGQAFIQSTPCAITPLKLGELHGIAAPKPAAAHTRTSAI